MAKYITKKRRENIGFFYAIVNSIIWGLYPVFTHYFVSYIDPLLFAGATYLVGSVPLLISLSIKNKVAEIYRPKLLRNFLLLATSMALGSLFFFFGTKFTSGINSGLLIQLEPFYAVVIGMLFLSEKIRRTQLLATFIMVIGAMVVSYKGIDAINLGDVLIVLAPIFYQIANMFVKKVITKTSVAAVVSSSLLYSGILLVVLAIIFNPASFYQLLIVKNIVAVLVFGLFLRTLDFVTLYKALQYIPMSKTSALIPFSVIISFIGALVFLKEAATRQQYGGLFLILGGLLILAVLQLRKSD